MILRLLALLIVAAAPSVVAQSFDQLTRPMVTLTDRVVIDRILSDLLILPPDSLTSMQMIDVTANGFGVDDLLILLPGGQVHHLDEYVPPALQEVMAGWSLEADYRYEALVAETGAALLTAHSSEDAAGAIAGSCVNAIATHYAGSGMNLLLSQGQGTARIEMWGFDPQGLQYGGTPEAISCEINRQKFEFARPITVTAFRDGDTCVEAWGDQGRVQTRPCSN